MQVTLDDVSQDERELVAYVRLRVEANIELAIWRRLGCGCDFAVWVGMRRQNWPPTRRAVLVGAMEALVERLRAKGVAIDG